MSNNKVIDLRAVEALELPYDDAGNVRVLLAYCRALRAALKHQEQRMLNEGRVATADALADVLAQATDNE